MTSTPLCLILLARAAVLVRAEEALKTPTDDMSACECSDDLGNCVDPTQWRTLCSVRKIVYPVQAVLILFFLLLFYFDYKAYRPIK